MIYRAIIKKRGDLYTKKAFASRKESSKAKELKGVGVQRRTRSKSTSLQRAVPFSLSGHATAYFSYV